MSVEHDPGFWKWLNEKLRKEFPEETEQYKPVHLHIELEKPPELEESEKHDKVVELDYTIDYNN
jgi:hypothetical protein